MNEVAPAKISFNDMVLKACALALKQHPKVNSSWLVTRSVLIIMLISEWRLLLKKDYWYLLCGLLTPNHLSQIAVEVKEYAQKAKDKKLQPSDWEAIHLQFQTWECLVSMNSLQS
jgi:pyruvate dehydrogenase E2 component (dihydrolipoamide acetyltransferase)